MLRPIKEVQNYSKWYTVWVPRDYYMLTSLIILANKHKDVCFLLQNPATISENFNIDINNFSFGWFTQPSDILTSSKEGQKLSDEGKTASGNVRGKTVFTLGKLYYPNDPFWKKQFNLCEKNQSIKYIVCLFAIKNRTTTGLEMEGHFNALVFNKKYRTMFRYDPTGSQGSQFGGVDKALPVLAKSLGYTVGRISDVCPAKGFQSIEKKDKRLTFSGGYCGIWSVFFLDVYFSNDEKNPLIVQNTLIQQMENNPINMRNLINNYTQYIYNQSRHVLRDLPTIIRRYLSNEDIFDEQAYRHLGRADCAYIGKSILRLCYAIRDVKKMKDVVIPIPEKGEVPGTATYGFRKKEY